MATQNDPQILSQNRQLVCSLLNRVFISTRLRCLATKVCLKLLSLVMAAFLNRLAQFLKWKSSHKFCGDDMCSSILIDIAFVV